MRFTIFLNELYHDKDSRYPLGAVVYEAGKLPFKNLPIPYFCIWWTVTREQVKKWKEVN